ncbi:unnamed protein product, partial [Tetraodon nigroviridis]
SVTMRNSGKHGLIKTPQRRRYSQTTTTRPSTALDACCSSAAGVLTGPSPRSGLLLWSLHKLMTYHSFSINSSISQVFSQVSFLSNSGLHKTKSFFLATGVSLKGIHLFIFHKKQSCPLTADLTFDSNQ